MEPSQPNPPHEEPPATAALAPAAEPTRAAHRLTEGSLSVGVLRFGAPLVIGMILHTTFNLVDMFMISRLPNSTAALAAIGICDMVAAVASIVSNGVATATVAVVARRAGSGDDEGVRRATGQSMLLVGALSVAFGVLGLIGSDFVIRTVMQAKGESADIAVRYLRVMLGGCFSIFLLLQLTAILRALGHSKSAAFLLIAGNALNVALGVLLIYGQGPYPAVLEWVSPIAKAVSAPRLEVQGAAWATLVGRTVPVILGAFFVARYVPGARGKAWRLRADWDELGNLVRLAWPASAQLVLRVSAVLVFISLVNANYTTATDQSVLSAYSICLRLETMALFIGMGWGAAATSFVGMNLGRGDVTRARNAGWIASAYNVVLMLVLIGLYVTFADRIVGFFDDSAATVAAGRQYLVTVAPSYALLAIAVVLSQAIGAASATFASLMVDVAVQALVIPAAIVLTEAFGVPRVGLWWVIAAGNALAAAAYALYYVRGSFFVHRFE